MPDNTTRERYKLNLNLPHNIFSAILSTKGSNSHPTVGTTTKMSDNTIKKNIND
jgi:hypothetical protein